MRASTVALLLVASCAHAASVGYSRRQSVQCAAVDKDGTALTASAGAGDFVSCTYEGAGECEYFPANGSFSSGSSQCPAGIAQDPSATTDAASSAGAEPTGTDDGDSDSASATGSDTDTDTDTETETDSDPALSTPNTSSTTPVISSPAASTPPPVSKTSASGGAASASGSRSASASPSASGQPGGARALSVPLGALLGAVGLGMMAL
ncbi:hypothetical protein C8R47DRAFT_1199692 [Mycena vitilis]|nr:hypothetical protein C8R47DRAFT_1199692 [Mycena vitilis]